MNDVNSSEKELFDRFELGFEVGFEELVSQYETRLYSLCLSLTPSEMDAEALLMQVFCEALDGIGEVIERQENLSHWLYRLAVDFAGDLEKLRHPEMDNDSDVLAPTIIVAAENADMDLDSEQLRKALHNLPYEYRVVYLLHESLGLNIDSIVNILSLSELETRAFLHRARLMVCRHLRRLGGFPVRAAAYETSMVTIPAPDILM